MATFRVHGLAVTVLIAVLLAVGLQSEGRADYPGPRWFGGQAPSQLLHNCPPGPCNPADEFVVTNPESSSGYGLTHVQATLNAITDWNNALRGSPNSITKYPLHYNQMYDPNANVIVEMVDNTIPYCGDRQPGPGEIEPPGCNTLHHVYIDGALQDDATELYRLIRHELGHSLWYSDMYYSDYHCANGQVQGGHSHASYVSIMDCDFSIFENPDETDFRQKYEPALQSSNPTYPDTWSATWNAFAGTGSVELETTVSDVEWNYYWEQRTDTTGAVISGGTGYTSTNDADRSYSYVLGSRYCTFAQIHNEVGYPAGRAWSPRSQYSCVSAPSSTPAGFFLATSDRDNPNNNNLHLRVKNFSAYTRNISVVGPQFQAIGCPYVSTAWPATRVCDVTLARGVYAHLLWFAVDPFNGSLYTMGTVDLE